MKKVKKLSKAEPTVSGVMGAVQDLTKAVQTGFAKIEDRFDKVEERMDDEFGQVSKRFEKVEGGIRILRAGQENLTEKVDDTHRRVVNLELRVEDVRDTLADITKAEEKDAEATINHGYRISHLEKLGGIKSSTPKHLAGL